MQLELEKPTSTTIPSGGGSVTQVLKVNNPSKVALKMRLKLNYVSDGTPMQDQMEVSNFPSALYQ